MLLFRMIAAMFAVVFGSTAALAAGAGGAGGPSFDVLTDAVDFGSTQTAILAVGALAIGLALVVLGIRKVMSIIRRA